MQKKHGFTLVELLVVIGIIAILAGIVAPKLFKAMDSAKEQQCRNNLRQLHAAVLHYAADNGQGQLPFAQSFEKHGLDSWSPNDGWIAWVPQGLDPAGLIWEDGSSQSSRFGDDLGWGEESMFAVQHGTLFEYVGDAAVYRCPVTANHSERFLLSTNGAAKINRTYVMSQFFGAPSYPIDWSADWRYITEIGVNPMRAGTDKKKFRDPDGDFFEYLPQADRLLLFSEVIPDPNGRRLYQRTGHADRAYTPYDGCIAPHRISDVTFTKKEVKWPGRGTIPFGVPTSELLCGLHEPLIWYAPGKVWFASALAVFFDGHIEKVFPVVETSDGEASAQANTAWFLNRGIAPATKIPEY